MKKYHAPAAEASRDNAAKATNAAAHRDRLRRSELAKLLPLWPHEIADLSLDGRRHVIRSLARTLRGERKRGRAGHWTYSVARHAALLKAYRSECTSLRALLVRNAIRACRTKRQTASGIENPGNDQPL